MQHYGSFRRNATWRLGSQLSHAAVPDHLRPWLLDASSLTQRVVSVCRGVFRVQVLAQAWMRPLAEEQRRLGLRHGALALVRQVQLLCNDQPWVYARTVLPRTTLTGRRRRLAYLGSRPLGAALFADPTLEREAVEIVPLAPGQTLFDMATRNLNPLPAQVWGRRSVFRVSGKPLLVSEIFLPGIPEAP